MKKDLLGAKIISHMAIFLLSIAFFECVAGAGGSRRCLASRRRGWAIAFSTDGQLLLSGTNLFTAASGKLIRQFPAFPITVVE